MKSHAKIQSMSEDPNLCRAITPIYVTGHTFWHLLQCSVCQNNHTILLSGKMKVSQETPCDLETKNIILLTSSIPPIPTVYKSVFSPFGPENISATKPKMVSTENLVGCDEPGNRSSKSLSHTDDMKS